jgi:protocatechuate 3,4-dioxygenase beta subunit
VRVNRRLGFLVVLVAAAVLAGTAGGVPNAATCAPTPTDGFGPFGRGLPPIRAKTGSGHVLTGVVLSALDCRPIPSAQVQLWQSNRKGLYTRALSATVLTDRSGRFRYESPLPTAYEGREPHIHIRVFARGHEPLLARYVPARGSRQGNVRLVLAPEAL